MHHSQPANRAGLAARRCTICTTQPARIGASATCGSAAGGTSVCSAHRPGGVVLESQSAGRPATGRAEEERDRVLGCRDRGHLLHGARLLDRRGHRDRGGRRRPAGAGDPVPVVHPDVPDRDGVLLHEPRRPGLRHQLLLDHARDRAEHRLDRGLRRVHHGPDRDRLAGRRGGVLHLRHPRLRVGAAHVRAGRVVDRAAAGHAAVGGDHRGGHGHLRDRHRARRRAPRGS